MERMICSLMNLRHVKCARFVSVKYEIINMGGLIEIAGKHFAANQCLHSLVQRSAQRSLRVASSRITQWCMQNRRMAVHVPVCTLAAKKYFQIVGVTLPKSGQVKTSLTCPVTTGL